MKTIPLSRGYLAIVDDEDFETISMYKWCVTVGAKNGKVYAVRNVTIEGGKKRHLPMHRQIMGLGYGDQSRVDHIFESQTLDNRKANLRICTASENSFNCNAHLDNRSGFKGVHWGSSDRRWVTQLNVNGKRVFRKGFKNVHDAAQAYMFASYLYCGEFSFTKP